MMLAPKLTTAATTPATAPGVWIATCLRAPSRADRPAACHACHVLALDQTFYTLGSPSHRAAWDKPTAGNADPQYLAAQEQDPPCEPRENATYGGPREKVTAFMGEHGMVRRKPVYWRQA